MNDNNNNKRQFYDNCPVCKEKIVVTIEVHNEPEEWVESRAKELLAEEFKKHLANAHPEEANNNEEKHKCSICGSGYSTEHGLEEHMRAFHRTPSVGDSTNFVVPEHKCPKCGMTKIIVVGPHNPNPDLNAIWQDHEQSGECAEQQKTDHYRCLKCGNRGAVSDLGFSGNSGWCKCGSKNLECWSGNFHWTTSECPDCHKFRDYKYHGLSPEHEARLKAQIKLHWENVNQWCGCPRSNVSNQQGERERERERAFYSLWNPTASN